MTFSLSPGQAHDAPEGRELLKRLGPPRQPLHLIMDRAHERNETRQPTLDLGFIPVVPPLSTRIESREYDRAMYKRRHEAERLLRMLERAARQRAAVALTIKTTRILRAIMTEGEAFDLQRTGVCGPSASTCDFHEQHAVAFALTLTHCGVRRAPEQLL